MKVDVVSRRLVKPCTPTPTNLMNYNISFMDELNPTMNVVEIVSQSLSKILPQFYPFAGRYMKHDHLVLCTDQGAQLVEANVDLELRQVTEPNSGIKPEQLNDLLPCEIGEADEETDPILSVQINKFTCGGIAIGICISHRIVDACSLGTFVSAWSNASLVKVDDTQEIISPSFDGPVFFPGKNFPNPEFGTTRSSDNSLYNIVCRRLMFDKNAISCLKAGATTAKTGGRLISRVQVISGLIMKAISMIDSTRALFVAQAVNMRERTIPAIPKHSCGNLAALAITECSAEESRKMGYEDFVRLLGGDARKTVADCARILSEGGYGEKFLIDGSHYASEKSLRSDVNVVWMTDWSKFRFYEADLGFGKPVWASVTNVVIKNHVLLMSNKEGDAIEAWVNLEENEMAIFDREINNLFVKLSLDMHAI
ncbi:hypothetical protein ABFS83_03G033300 [Erythranthe nasuta]